MMASTPLTGLTPGQAKPTSASVLPADDASSPADFASMLLGLACSEATADCDAAMPRDDMTKAEAAPAADARVFDPALAAETHALDPALLIQLATPLAGQPAVPAPDTAPLGIADATAVDRRVDPGLPVEPSAEQRVLVDAAATTSRASIPPPDAGALPPAAVPNARMPATEAIETLDQASPDSPASPAGEPSVRLGTDGARNADKVGVPAVDDKGLESAPPAFANPSVAAPTLAARMDGKRSDAPAPEVGAFETTPATPLGGATGHAPATPSPIGSSPAATPTSDVVATAFDSPEFAAALGARVSVLARNGVQRAELQLNPAEMGPIAVQIDLDGAHAVVHFSADVAATRSVLESSWPELAAALRDSGLTLAGGGVSEQATQRGRRDATSDAARHGRHGDAAAHAEREAAAPRPRRTRGVVDLIA